MQWAAGCSGGLCLIAPPAARAITRLSSEWRLGAQTSVFSHRFELFRVA
jgi:hypothetical protein